MCFTCCRKILLKKSIYREGLWNSSMRDSKNARKKLSQEESE